MKNKIIETIENFSSIDSTHGLNSYTISERNLERLAEDLVKLFAIPVVVGSTLTQTTQRELLDTEFYCSKCDTIHTKTAYAIAQTAMNVELIFTCTCGNKIDL